MKNKRINYLTQGAIIAAIYVVLTIALAPIGYGAIQIRVSEALTILPYFTPAAIPGLFIGCIIANFNSPLGIIDIVFGSLASLIAAIITSRIKDKRFAPLPSIIVNAIIIPFVLKYALGLPYFVNVILIAMGQTIACYGIGYPLLILLEKKRLFNKVK